MEAIEAKQIHIRFTRALSSYDNHADAQHRISRKLASLLPHQANVRYRRMLEIGCGTGGFTGVLKQQCHIDEWRAALPWFSSPLHSRGCRNTILSRQV